MIFFLVFRSVSHAACVMINSGASSLFVHSDDAIKYLGRSGSDSLSPISPDDNF